MHMRLTRARGRLTRLVVCMYLDRQDAVGASLIVVNFNGSLYQNTAEFGKLAKKNGTTYDRDDVTDGPFQHINRIDSGYVVVQDLYYSALWDHNDGYYETLKQIIVLDDNYDIIIGILVLVEEGTY